MKEGVQKLDKVPLHRILLGPEGVALDQLIEEADRENPRGDPALV